MAQIPFSLIKKIKTGRAEHSLTPPLRPITSDFCLTPHPLQSGRHMCITTYQGVQKGTLGTNELNTLLRY